MTITKNIYN